MTKRELESPSSQAPSIPEPIQPPPAKVQKVSESKPPRSSPGDARSSSYSPAAPPATVPASWRARQDAQAHTQQRRSVAHVSAPSSTAFNVNVQQHHHPADLKALTPNSSSVGVRTTLPPPTSSFQPPPPPVDTRQHHHAHAASRLYRTPIPPQLPQMESATSRAHVCKDAGPPPWTQPLKQSKPLATEGQIKTQNAEVRDLRAYAVSQGADLDSVRMQTQALTASPPKFDDGRRRPDDRRSPDDQGREAVMALFSYPRPTDMEKAASPDERAYYPGVSEERKAEMERARDNLVRLGKQFESENKMQKGQAEAALEKCPKPNSTSADSRR